MRRLKNWLLRKLGARWFVQSARISGCELAVCSDQRLPEQIAYQKARALMMLIRDLEFSGHLEWIVLPRTGDDHKFLWKLRVV